MNDDRWDQFLDAFHAERPGITESVLANARDQEGNNPYAWVLDALPERGLIIDAACGSGPLGVRAPRRWIGVDRSLGEAGVAADRAPGRVVVGDATAAPFRSGAAHAVACSMAVMLFDDPAAAVVEMARLLIPGGLLVVLVPTAAPLTIRDRARYARLLGALRLRRLPFRHDEMLDDLPAQLTAAGLAVTSDDRRRFVYPFTGPEAGLTWQRSLYLPDIPPHRTRAAQRVVQRWTGSSIGIPLRRLVTTKRH